jgi:integrase/recombinase XerD
MENDQSLTLHEEVTCSASLHLLLPDNSSLSVPLPDGILIADCFILQQWLTAKRAVTTKEAYGHDIGEFYHFQIQEQNKNTITRMGLDDLQAYAACLIAKELKPSSQSRKLACVRSLFSFAAKLRYTPVNTALLLTLPKVDDRLAERILPEEDFHKMIDNEPILRDRVILMVLYYGGLRASEVCSLQWRQFLPRQYDPNFGATLSVHGKGGTRYVSVKHVVWNALQDLKQKMIEQGYATSSESYVFQADPEQRTKVPTGTMRMHKNTIYKIVKRVAKHAELKDVSVSAHWFRHGHATYAQAHGASAVLVKETLGHKSLATTTKYSHIINNDGSGRYL